MPYPIRFHVSVKDKIISFQPDDDIKKQYRLSGVKFNFQSNQPRIEIVPALFASSESVQAIIRTFEQKQEPYKRSFIRNETTGVCTFDFNHYEIKSEEQSKIIDDLIASIERFIPIAKESKQNLKNEIALLTQLDPKNCSKQSSLVCGAVFFVSVPEKGRCDDNHNNESEIKHQSGIIAN